MIYRIFVLLAVLLLSTSCAELVTTIQNEFPTAPLAAAGNGMFHDAAWSPDGQTLAVASTRGIWLYPASNLATDGELLTVSGGTGIVEYSPSGRYLTSVGADGRIWDAETGEQILVIYERDPRETSVGDGRAVRWIAFSTDERYIVVTGYRIFSLWDLATREVLFERQGDSPRLSPDGKTLLFTDYGSDNDGMILHRIDIASNEEIWSIRLDDFTYQIRWQPDGKNILTIFDNPNTSETAMRFWSGETGKLVTTLNGYEFGNAQVPFVFNPAHPNFFAFVDYQAPYVPGFEASIVVWEMTTDETGYTLPNLPANTTSVAFSRDGRLLATSEESKFETRESYVRLWNAEDGSVIAVSPAFIREDIQKVVFSPDGTHLISVHSNGMLHVWNTSDLTSVQTIGDGSVTAQFAADGTAAVTGNNDGQLQIWVIDERAQTAVRGVAAQSEYLPLNSLAADASLSVVAFTTGDSFDDEADGRVHTLQVWKPTTGELTVLHEDEAEGVGAIAINAPGTILAAVMKGGVVLWDIASGERLPPTLTGPKDFIVTLVFSPDNRLLASGGCGRRDVEGSCDQGEIHLWELTYGDHLLGPINEHTSAVYALAFAPDGKTFVTGSGGAIYWGTLDDYSVLKWDTATGERIGTPVTDHMGQITDMTFNSGGQYVLSGSGDSVFGYDSTIRLRAAWTLFTSLVFADNSPAIQDVVFSPDSALFLTIHQDGSIRFWKVPPGTTH
jgi:WD40 repeat protein